MKLFSHIFINFEICYPKVINKEMWARVLPCVNVCVFLHKCSLSYAHSFQLCSCCIFFFFFLRSLTHSLIRWLYHRSQNFQLFFFFLSSRTYIRVLYIYEKQSKFILCIFFFFVSISWFCQPFCTLLNKIAFLQKEMKRESEREKKRYRTFGVWHESLFYSVGDFTKNMPHSPTAFHFSTLRRYTQYDVSHRETIAL